MGIFSGIRDFLGRPRYVAPPGDSPLILDLRTESVYRTQPNVRAVVSFVADNIAGLPLKVYRHDEDGGRSRVRDDVTATLLRSPNPDQTTFELVRELVSDILLYDRAYLLVLRDDTPSGWWVRPLPPAWVDGYVGTSPFAPESLVVQPPNGATRFEVPADRLVIFHGYRPGDPSRGSSPIECLKDVIQEQAESDRYRLSVWRNGGRASGYITRPKDVEPWSPESADRFRKQFKEAWTGRGANGGGVIVLEDGMELRQTEFNAKDAQWAEAKQLSRQEVAAQYHIKPALIWDEGQTYASVKENSRSLYAESLAPRLAELEQRLNAFLLPRLGASPDVYVEFDLTAKLRGSFEEQASIFQSACGGPWMSRNEARAMNNLPAIEGGDKLITPLNVITGGLASPNDTDGTIERYAAEPQAKAAPVCLKGRSSKDEDDALADTLREFFEHQKACVLPKLGAKAAEWWDEERWDGELAKKLQPVIQRQADSKGADSARELGSAYEPERTQAYLKKLAQMRAHAINVQTLRDLEGRGEEPAADVFERAKSERATTAGRAIAMTVAAFAISEAISQSQHEGGDVTKTWVTTSSNPRSSHQAMNGETVPYDQNFSNGAFRPGDIDLDPAEACNCQCAMDITVKE